MGKLWTREYGWWLVGDSGAVFGNGVRTIALPLLALGVTGSAAEAGIIAATTTGMSVLAALPGGALIDAIDRRVSMRLYSVIGVTLWALISALAFFGGLNFWLLLVLTALAGLNGGLFGHATDAALRSIVQGELYAKAQATNQGRDAAVELGAGPLGSLLYGVGAWVPFVLSMFGYLLLTVTTFTMRTDLRPIPGEDPPKLRLGNLLPDLREAADWLWARSTLLRALIFVGVFAAGFTGVLFLQISHLTLQGVRPAQIALVTLSLSIGLLLGALPASFLITRVRTGWFIAASFMLIPLTLLPTMWWPSPEMVMVCLGLAALTIPLANSSMMGFLMAVVPTHLQGRMQAIAGLTTGVFTALMPALVGILLERVGYRPTLTVALLLMATGAVLVLVTKGIRTIGKPSTWESHPLS